eukprot:CAMPEP_0168419372 /NCGR_PEP_ID=MMETSP0228-20121227/32234_1 /TAXON_ID=133427 /ORGANISM="Protoceratium reticulatum, Strain CCCM 535 (=CCMP 1889)" /LENGTH=221 /DNA_ID=CAMNT_0008433251 /DNA_START=40 /DNA_END=702 /DNA_ORIENTATION=+
MCALQAAEKASLAETAVPGLVTADDSEDVLSCHLRPVLVEEEHLAVCELEHQEVAQPALPRGADEDVGVRHVPREQPLGDLPLVDGLRLQLAGGRLPGQLPAGLRHVAAATVADADVKLKAAARRGPLLQPPHLGLEFAGKQPSIGGEEAHPDVEPGRMVAKSRDFSQEEVHHGLNLVGFTLPILCREGEDRQDPDADLRAPLHQVAELLPTGAVAADRAP